VSTSGTARATARFILGAIVARRSRRGEEVALVQHQHVGGTEEITIVLHRDRQVTATGSTQQKIRDSEPEAVDPHAIAISLQGQATLRVGNGACAVATAESTGAGPYLQSGRAASVSNTILTAPQWHLP